MNNPVFFDKKLLFENHTNLKRHLLKDKRITAIKATGNIRERNVEYKYVFPSDFDDMYAMSERDSRIQNYAKIWTQKSQKYRGRKMEGLAVAAEVVAASDD